MSEKSPAFKKPTGKHKPFGLTILFEDRDIIVVDKINGLLTVGNDRERAKTAYFLLTDYVQKRKFALQTLDRVFIVHRLDRDTSGILVFAKNENAKRYLQDNWKVFTKTYFAIVHGKPEEKEGTITSYLTENKMHRMYSTKDTGKGKLSKTGFKVIKNRCQIQPA